MKLEGTELILNRASKLIIDKRDEVSNCKIRVHDSGLGSEHPIEIKAYGMLRNCLIYSEISEPVILIHKDGACIGNALFPMSKYSL